MTHPQRAWRERYRPAASRRVQRVLAANLWSLVGTGVGVAGAVWTAGGAHGALVAILVALAAMAGWAKGRFVLAKTARRTLVRIERRGDGRCLGGFLSWKSWGLVLVMIVGGRLLRAGPVPHTVLGPVYLAIGVALLTGSLVFWRGREIGVE